MSKLFARLAAMFRARRLSQAEISNRDQYLAMRRSRGDLALRECKRRDYRRPRSS